MSTVGIQEAQTRLSQLIERVATGEEITITRGGHPVARRAPVEQQPSPAIDKAVPIFGTDDEWGRAHPQEFYEFTDEEIAEWFEDEPGEHACVKPARAH